MRHIRALSAILALTALSTGAGAGVQETDPPREPRGSETVSVGDFLLRCAGVMALSLPEEAGPEKAAEALKQRGLLQGDVDLGRPLTEGDVVRLASRLGICLTTLEEDRPLTAGLLDSFFATFGGVLKKSGSAPGSDEDPCAADRAGREPDAETESRLP